MFTLPFFRAGTPAVDADDGLVELLICGQALPADSGSDQLALAALLVAASGAPGEVELANEQQVLVAFRALRGAHHSAPARLRLRRSSMLTSLSTLISSKLALAAAAGAVTLGGAAAAAYTNVLPTSLQNFAHDTIGAPAAANDTSSAATTDAKPTAEPTAEPTATPVGPDASGPAAYGLCTAYLASSKNTPSPSPSAAPSPSVAFQALITAAGGVDKVAAYCAATTPGGKAATDHPTGAPSPHPTGAPSPLTTGAPSPHPTSAPASVSTTAPVTYPTSSPTAHPGR